MGRIDETFRAAPGTDESAEIVDISHVRWAVGSSITALDLCAAVLGRLYCLDIVVRRQLDMRSFDPSGKDIKAVGRERMRLPTPVVEWVDSVLADLRYCEVLQARNPLTHSRVRRVLSNNPAEYTRFKIAGTEFSKSSRDMVVEARDLATERVTSFLQLVSTLP